MKMKCNFETAAAIGFAVMASTAQAQLPESVPPPVQATDAEAAKRTTEAITNSKIVQCLSAVSTEVQPILSSDNVSSKLKLIRKFEFSEATKKKLTELYGNDHPLKLQGTHRKDGTSEISYVMDGLKFHDPDNGTFTQASPLTGQQIYRRQNTQSNSVLNLATIHFDRGDGFMVDVHDLTYSAKKALSYPGLWFGGDELKVARISIDDAGKNWHLKVDGTAIRSELRKRGKSVDIESDTSTRSINWGQDEVGPVHMNFQLSNVDGQSIAAYVETQKQLERSDLAGDARAAVSMHMLGSLGLATLKNGGAVDIKDISVQYHGMTASANGRVVFKGIQESDFASPQALLGKLDARFNLKVPVNLITEISKIFIRNKLTAEGDGTLSASDPIVDQMANEATRRILDDPLKKKWIRFENGALTSTIQFKGGQLTVNGEAIVALPSTK